MTLQEAVEATGLSIPELARRAGLAYANFNDVVKGRNKRPAHDTVVRIVRALQASGLPDITTSQLFPVPRVITVPPDSNEDHA